MSIMNPTTTATTNATTDRGCAAALYPDHQYDHCHYCYIYNHDHDYHCHYYYIYNHDHDPTIHC